MSKAAFVLLYCKEWWRFPDVWSGNQWGFSVWKGL